MGLLDTIKDDAVTEEGVLRQKHGPSDFSPLPAPCTFTLPFRELPQVGFEGRLCSKLQGALNLLYTVVAAHSSELLVAGGEGDPHMFWTQPTVINERICYHTLILLEDPTAPGRHIHSWRAFLFCRNSTKHP